MWLKADAMYAIWGCHDALCNAQVLTAQCIEVIYGLICELHYCTTGLVF
jgi:hypothetical protein